MPINYITVSLFSILNISNNYFNHNLERSNRNYFEKRDSIQIINKTDLDISYYLVYTLSVEQIFLPKNSSVKFEPAEEDVILIQANNQCNYFLKSGKSYFVDKIVNGNSRIKNVEKNIENDLELDFFPLCIDSFGILRPLFFTSPKNKFASLSARDQKMDDNYDKQINFLKQYVEKNRLSYNFFQNCEYILNMARVSRKTQVFDKSKNINELKENINKWRSETYEYYKDSLRKFIDLINQEDIHLNVFERDLLENVAILIQHNQFNGEYNDTHIDFFIKRHTRFKGYFEGFIRDYMVTENLMDCIRAGFDIPEDLKLNYDGLEVNGFYSEYLNSLIVKRSIRNSLEKDTIMLLLTNSGAQVKWEDILKSYKGKYLFIDFWASWCQPCRFEMPLSKKLASQFDKNKIVFIYISIDERVGDWEKANFQVGLNGEGNSFLLLDASRAYEKKYFGISAIPRYMIFDNGGKVINNDAPRPGNPNCERILRSLSNKWVAMKQ